MIYRNVRSLIRYNVIIFWFFKWKHTSLLNKQCLAKIYFIDLVKRENYILSLKRMIITNKKRLKELALKKLEIIEVINTLEEHWMDLWYLKRKCLRKQTLGVVVFGRSVEANIRGSARANTHSFNRSDGQCIT